ncbi:transcriptional regulator [Paenibacillus sp. NPDC057967]|uniref:transcriptional regulator n=1 Tax=Paenibacillus sp. NPDC057967 TaxID=3346293 RepID=UPI0036D8C51E
MSKAKNKSILSATISGEMKPQDIPLAPGVDLDAIKAGDDDPLEVVVEVPAGKSTRGWNYLPESLKAIVDHVNQYTLSGFKGHQKEEDVANVFEDPVTHWVGAKMDGNRAYFRGIVDAVSPDLKRWIRAGRIKQVSIYGMPKLQTVDGETQVIDYKPLSIDWTPLDRSGMPTRIVAVGEMDDNEGGDKDMDWKELLAQLLAKITAGETNLKDVLAGLDADTAAKLELLNKVKNALGVTEDDKLLASVEQASKALKDADQAALGQTVKEVVKEKVAGEMAQGLLLKLVKPKAGQTKETISGEIDSLLADDSIKAMLGRMQTDLPPFIGGFSGNDRTTTTTDSVPI